MQGRERKMCWVSTLSRPMSLQLSEKLWARLSRTQVQLSSGALNRFESVSLEAGGDGRGVDPRKGSRKWGP